MHVCMCGARSLGCHNEDLDKLYLSSSQLLPTNLQDPKAVLILKFVSSVRSNAAAFNFNDA